MCSHMLRLSSLSSASCGATGAGRLAYSSLHEQSLRHAYSSSVNNARTSTNESAFSNRAFVSADSSSGRMSPTRERPHL